ncbi:MAG: ribonuclease III [Bacteroidales bacterium]|nr:ribonuclease III [Bacteroidales bacterium]
MPEKSKGLKQTHLLLPLKNIEFIYRLTKILGYIPRNISIYKTAFTPKSAIVKTENGDPVNNERLEFLGDAILNAIVAEILFERFPQDNEGFLTKVRARIVERKNLDFLAESLNIPAMIIGSPQQENLSRHLYGNALEAMIAAVYLDRGYRTVKRFFRKRIMQNHIDLLKMVRKDSDYKSRIIEWAQKNKKDIVFNTHEENTSENMIPGFISHVELTGIIIGTGKGYSKKEAEQNAAKEAISYLQDF